MNSRHCRISKCQNILLPSKQVCASHYRKMMKGQVIFYWMFSLIMIFVLALTYMIFVPFFQVPFGDTMRNITISTTNGDPRPLAIIDQTIMAFSTGIVACIVLYVIFALVATHKREDQVNVYSQ